MQTRIFFYQGQDVGPYNAPEQVSIISLPPLQYITNRNG